MATTLVVNPGSSSRKYALYQDGQLIIELQFEDTHAGFEFCEKTIKTQQICESITQSDFANAFEKVAEEVERHLFHIGTPQRLDAVSIRVVAPGSYFQQHRLIDEQYLVELKKREVSAPLHVPVMLREIKEIKKHFPHTALVGASDSAFHCQMPSRAREYSIAREDIEQFDVHRFGYHGLSVASVVRRIHAVIGRDPDRMVVCHVGNGTSVTAVKQGQGVETSMGFAPGSGLPMGSRAGEIDTAALLELMRIKHWRPSEAEMYINSSGGLAGMSGDSDIRRLLDRRAKHDDVASHALDVFAYHIQKEIAAQTVALGGLDVLVLTATASVRSAELRKLILAGLAHLGIQLSDDRNDLHVGKDGVISVRNSPVKVVVMRTDEMGEMAYIAEQLTVSKR